MHTHKHACAHTHAYIHTHMHMHTHTGLVGVNVGALLIKLLTPLLQTQMSSLESFVTLSPIPSFGRWFESQLGENNKLEHARGGGQWAGIVSK
jgi:hypothetical protein